MKHLEILVLTKINNMNKLPKILKLKKKRVISIFDNDEPDKIAVSEKNTNFHFPEIKVKIVKGNDYPKGEIPLNDVDKFN